MKEIPLSRGLVALVDDEDYDDLIRFKWRALKKDTGSAYAGRYCRIGGRGTIEYMHRRILGAKPEDRVDHKDHNGLNNQKENIRICTISQNQWNQRRQAGKSSKYKGVNWSRDFMFWEARIAEHRKRHFLGYFNTPEDAALAYDRAAKRYHGEFAYLNFPEEKQ